MDTRELQKLLEAYEQVHAPQEVDEAVKGVDSEQRKSLAAERKAGIKPLSAKEGERYASHKMAQMAYAKRKRMGEEVEEFDIFDIVLEFLQAEGYAETLEEAEWMMANVIDEEAIDIILGEGMTMQDFKKQRSRQKQKEKRAAEKTSPTRRAGMSSYERAVRHRVNVDPDYDRDHEERDYPGGVTKNPKKIRKAKALGEIGEDYVNEAQVANRDPDKYEREQSKKYAPVRGERTPMPPRGDRRREDFERWYRANVREEVEEIDEEITSEKGKAKAAEMIAKRTTASGRAKSGQGDTVAQIRHISRANVDGYGGTPPNRKVAKNPVKSNFTGLKGGTGNKAARRAGLTPTREKPNAWKEDYVNEAQVANRDPDKYEREQSKKYAPVRGERTPMPPRGDKRREDFEKWYAKQMGR